MRHRRSPATTNVIKVTYYISKANGVINIAGLLARLGGLRQPVLCVEPVKAMLDRARVNNIANIQVREVIMCSILILVVSS